MRRGFTMIELIFVIVIIGILAAVAIPKLSATRDDAKVAKSLENLKMCTNDIQAYYTAQEKESPNATDTDGSAGFKSCLAVKNEDCFKVDLGSDLTDGNITVKHGNASANWCTAARTKAATRNIATAAGVDYTFGGEGVKE